MHTIILSHEYLCHNNLPTSTYLDQSGLSQKVSGYNAGEQAWWIRIGDVEIFRVDINNIIGLWARYCNGYEVWRLHSIQSLCNKVEITASIFSQAKELKKNKKIQGMLHPSTHVGIGRGSCTPIFICNPVKKTTAPSLMVCSFIPYQSQSGIISRLSPV